MKIDCDVREALVQLVANRAVVSLGLTKHTAELNLLSVSNFVDL